MSLPAEDQRPVAVATYIYIHIRYKVVKVGKISLLQQIIGKSFQHSSSICSPSQHIEHRHHHSRSTHGIDWPAKDSKYHTLTTPECRRYIHVQRPKTTDRHHRRCRQSPPSSVADDRNAYRASPSGPSPSRCSSAYQSGGCTHQQRSTCNATMSRTTPHGAPACTRRRQVYSAMRRLYIQK